MMMTIRTLESGVSGGAIYKANSGQRGALYLHLLQTPTTTLLPLPTSDGQGSEEQRPRTPRLLHLHQNSYEGMGVFVS